MDSNSGLPDAKDLEAQIQASQDEIETTQDRIVDLMVAEHVNRKNDEDAKNTAEVVNLRDHPALPAHLAAPASKSADDLMAELNRLPFFMNDLSLGETFQETPELEALKALAFEGEPEEVAENFKRQGNECYKKGQFKTAVEFYTKGLAAKCHIKPLEAALYSNRAACNLELKNYRRFIDDSRECLIRQPKNLKALFRAAKAYCAIEKYEEARQILNFAISINDNDSAINSLSKSVDEKIASIEEYLAKKRLQELAKEKIAKVLSEALKYRGIKSIDSSYPISGPGVVGEAVMRLDDEHDFETILYIPTLILYPTIEEFDLVTEVPETSCPLDLMELVMDRPEEYFQDGKHDNFRPKHLESYMETDDGGLVQLRRRTPFSQILMSQIPRVPLFDRMLRIYFVPKVHSKKWVADWSKEEALSKRK